ncbi:MAG: lycopene cyclase domain-containing protein [Nanoarchaeota archaeon]
MNAWLAFSFIFLGIWGVVWIAKPSLRKEMIWASILTAPFGLTEPIFVPEYWSPPSLFNLAATTGFDIESLIFSFSVGGIGAILYETFVKARHIKMSPHEKNSSMHRHHLLTLISPILIFLPLYLFTSLNPIYSASIAMAIGAIAALFCRPDLKKKMLFGSLMFLALYFMFFVSFNLVYPGIVKQVWNLQAISGILIFGVPLEELMFALTLGALWSSYYEHIKWYKISLNKGRSLHQQKIAIKKF